MMILRYLNGGHKAPLPELVNISMSTSQLPLLIFCSWEITITRIMTHHDHDDDDEDEEEEEGEQPSSP